MLSVNSMPSMPVNLGSWSTTNTSGIPSQERSAISMTIRAYVCRSVDHA